MTFHVGNGITLTQAEENLPDEEREEVIRRKREAQAAERDAERVTPKDYGLGDDIDGTKADEAVSLVNKVDAENEAEAAKRSGGRPKDETSGAFGLPEGSFGVRKNEDFSEYRRQRDAAHKAVRAARSAKSQAEGERRAALLASGRYYDDGRGNIRLKAAERQYMTGDRKHRHVRTADDDGSAMASIRAAGQSAWDAAIAAQRDETEENALQYSRNAVMANREAAAQRRRAQEEAATNTAKAKLSVFDGFAAALDALRADATNAKDNVVSVWGGKDEQGRDARWTYDEQGRIRGQADSREVVDGKRLASGGVQKQSGDTRRGFVDPTVLKSINAQLERRGAGYAISGIMSQQSYGALGKPLDGTEPTFYVQGVRNDGSKFGQYMTMKDVYRWGADSYRGANGLDGKDGTAEDFASAALGGYAPYGFRKKEVAAPSVEAAKVRAQGALDLEDRRQKGRIDLASLTGEQKKELQQAALVMKKYGIDVDAQTAREKTESAERVAAQKAQGVAFNKTVYERMAAIEDRLAERDDLTEADKERLAYARRVMREMEGYGNGEQEEKKEGFQFVLDGGDVKEPAKTAETKTKAEKPSAAEIDAELAKRKAASAKTAETQKPKEAKETKTAETQKPKEAKTENDAKDGVKWDDATEAEFQEYFKDMKNSRHYQGISEEEARKRFEDDIWRKLKKRVKENINNDIRESRYYYAISENAARGASKSSGRRATGVL